jgi:hypothetical protein
VSSPPSAALNIQGSIIAAATDSAGRRERERERERGRERGRERERRGVRDGGVRVGERVIKYEDRGSGTNGHGTNSCLTMLNYAAALFKTSRKLTRTTHGRTNTIHYTLL